MIKRHFHLKFAYGGNLQFKFSFFIWAAPSEFVFSSIPSWQTLTAHAQPFRGARDLAFCLKVPLDSLLVWASSEGSGETARMRRLAWTFAARIGDKYQIRLARPICSVLNLHIFNNKCSPLIYLRSWSPTGIKEKFNWCWEKSGLYLIYILYGNCEPISCN